MRQNCKDYKIYRIKMGVRGEPTPKKRKNAWDKAGEKVELTVKLINKFSPENFDELVKYTLFAKHLGIQQIKYKKDWLFDQYEIGKDILKETFGMAFEFHWSSEYWFVPKNQPEIIEWMDANVPKWVKTVKRV